MIKSDMIMLKMQRTASFNFFKSIILLSYYGNVRWDPTQLSLHKEIILFYYDLFPLQLIYEVNYWSVFSAGTRSQIRIFPELRFFRVYEAWPLVPYHIWEAQFL